MLDEVTGMFEMTDLVRHPLTRLLVGLFAAAPLVVIASVIVIFVSGTATNLPWGRIVIIAIAVSAVLYLAAVGALLYLVETESSFDSADKSRWTTMILLWFPFGALSFWWQFVWRNR